MTGRRLFTAWQNNNFRGQTMVSVCSRIGSLLLIALIFLLAGCGGDNAEGDQSDLLVCENNEVILANGQCGIPPQVSCEPPEILVDGACIVPDDPEPVYKPEPGEAVIYYNRRDKNFNGWVLHLWSDCSSPSRGSWDGPNLTEDFTYSGSGTTWPTGPAPNHEDFEGVDPIYGAYWVLRLQDNPDCGNFIIHNDSTQTSDLSLNFSSDPANPYANMYWVLVDNATAEADLRQARSSGSPLCINDICQEFEPPPLIVENMEAHWIDAGTVVWNRDLSNVVLYGSPDGSLDVDDGGNVTGSSTTVSLTATTLTDAQLAANPQFSGYSAYALDLTTDAVKSLLKQQLYIVGEDTGAKLYGTRLQTAGVLDAVYTSGENDADEASLGPVYNDSGSVTVSLWAPTALDVKLRLFERVGDSGNLVRTDEVAMSLDTATGIWSATGSNWDRKYYRFRVSVFNPHTNEMQLLEVQDPYSVSAWFNGTHSQFVNLGDADLKPEGWDGHTVPTVASPEAAVIYEGHIRDFSIRDESTPEDYRGKYLAFTQPDSAPVQHLQDLQAAGLTHFHFLPSFDFASVDENPFEQINLDSTVFELCEAIRPDVPDVCDGRESNTATLLEVFQNYREDEEDARDLAAVMRDLDGFNWGYDPLFYNVPEGSYASDPRGEIRILEMRAMIKALHDMGLRVVMDVVYNHTSDSGVESAKAIFDKIVPGYYFRRNPLTGNVEDASCCNDTASENAMMAKLVKDSLVQWTQQYGIDGYRFDIMSLMPKQLIVDSLEAVQAVDPDTYFYGEGWPTLLSTADDALFERANQLNMAGTGIGTFNDRMRDPMRALNLINGENVNRLRTGLAGNLAEFQLVTSSGTTIKASSDGGYTLDPQESVNYVEKHDNETLWDWIHQEGSLPEDATLEQRVRIHNLTQSLVLLSQGVPFIHMGSDLLRSKSMDGNSYNSGDWFNYIDFTGQTNNWAVGLPPVEGNNATDTEIIDAFRDTEALPQPENIAYAGQIFQEFLAIGTANPLFSLRTEQEVLDRVGFHNMGTNEVPGLIVMSIDDGFGTVTGTEDEPRPDLDPNNDAIVVVFNGNDAEISHTVPTATGFSLHSTLQSSADPVVQTASFTEPGEEETGGTFTVPAYTAAVFVKTQGAAQGEGLSAFASTGYEPPVPFGDTTIYARGTVSETDWSTEDPFTYVGGGVYKAYLQLAAGSYEFKLASAEWEMEFSSADTGDLAVVVGVEKPLGPGAGVGNLTLDIAEDGEYLFTLDALDPDAPTLMVTNADVFAETHYIRGVSGNWDPGTALPYIGKSIYQVTLTGLAAVQHEFKIATADWGTEFSSADSGNVVVEEGVAKILGPGSGVSNMTFTPSEAGDYLFTVDASNSLAPVLTVVKADPYAGTAVYLRGDMNGWGTDDQLMFQGAATYSVDKVLTAAATALAFKVASNDWSTVNLGADDNAEVILNTPVRLLQDSQTNFSILIETDGTYTFRVDASGAQPVLLVTPADTVE